MIIFLRQEIHRIDRVIRTVRNSLNDLQLAIDGIIILNEVRSHTRTKRSDCQLGVPSPFVKYSIRSMTVAYQRIGCVVV